MKKKTGLIVLFNVEHRPTALATCPNMEWFVKYIEQMYEQQIQQSNILDFHIHIYHVYEP